MVAYELLLEQFKLALILIFERALEILKQPMVNKEMLWILLPLLVTLFLIELYFSSHEEELGWNSALANSLVLFFVGLDLTSYLYNKKMFVGIFAIEPALFEAAIKRTFLAILILVESVLLIVLNFFHLVDKRFAFGISSGLILNFIGVICIILIYSNIKMDIVTLPAVLFIFISLLLFFALLKVIVPKQKEEFPEEE